MKDSLIRGVGRVVLSGFLAAAPLLAGAADELVVREQKSVARDVNLVVGDSVPRKTFRFSAGEGWLDADGSFRLKAEVAHRKLRCVRYQLAVQFGTGAAGCSDVEWLGDMRRLSNKSQCNSAVLVHSGGDRLEMLEAEFGRVSCAHLQVTCSGDACR